MAPSVEPLEVRALLSSIAIDGSGNLVITGDSSGSPTDDMVTIQANSAAGTFVISDPGNVPSTTTIQFSSVTGQILVNTLDGDDSLTVDFSLGNFPRSLTFNGGDGGDTVTTLPFAGVAQFDGDVVINGDAGHDLVEWNAAVNLSNGHSLNINLTDDAAINDSDQIRFGNNSWVSAFGLNGLNNPGTIDLRASRNIELLNNSRVQTSGGTLTLEANQGTVATGGSFIGIALNAGVVVSSATGNITLKGRGGDGGGSAGQQIGIRLDASSTISAGGAGTVTVTGTGGMGSGLGNNGVVWEGNITSAGGAILVTGTVTPSLDNFAIAVHRDNLVLNPATTTLDGGTGTVLLRPLTPGTLINLGGPDATGVPATLGLTDVELDRITAGLLLIGDPKSGTLTVTAPITLGTHLAITSGAGITVGQPITLAADKDLRADLFGTTGLVQLTTVDADLSVSGTGTISLSATTLDLVSGSSLATVDSSVFLKVNSINLAGTVNAGAGIVAIVGAVEGRAIDVGAVGDPAAGPLSLSDAELDSITAGAIDIGDIFSGPIAISAAIDRAAATNLSLRTAVDKNISFLSGGSLDANGGDVSLFTDFDGTGAILGDAAAPNIRGNLLSLGAGSGGIGSRKTPVSFDGVSLRTKTGGNGSQFLRELNSVEIFGGTGSQFLRELNSVETFGGTGDLKGGLNAGSGAINFNGGTFTLGGMNQINDEADVALAFGATFDLGTNSEAIDQLVLIDGSVSGNGTLTGSSTFDLRKGSIEVNLAGANTAVGVSKIALDLVTLSGANNSYSGETTISSGTLALVSTTSNNSIPNSTTITVQSDAALDVNGLDTVPTTDTLILASGQTLQGFGTVLGKLIAPNGSTISPGNSPGILSSGSVNLQAGSTLNIEVNDIVPGTGHDQLNVSGSVMLGDATLSLSGTINSVSPGQPIVIVNNDGSDSVTGTFKLLPQGSVLTVGGTTFHIFYNFDSSDGQANDVALIANHLPVLNAQNFTVDETASAGTVIGTVVASDADSTVTFAIKTGNSSGTFALDSRTGQLTVNDPTGLASSSSFSLTVTVTDDVGATATATMTIDAFGPAPDAPSDVDTTNSNVNDGVVPEGAIPGTRVGITFSATDPQGDDVFYRLTDDAGGRFTVDPLTGVVTVKTSYLLNFADATQHTIRGRAVDAAGHISPEATFVIDVTEVPVDALPIASILPSRVSVVEGDPSDPSNKFVSFTVKLNKPSAETVQIDFSTRVGDEPGFVRPEGIPADASFATDEPGPWDFFRSSGRLVFDPGVTEQTVRVQLRPDDDAAELNELFFVQLNLPKDVPVNVRLSAGQSIAVAEILEDDSAPQVIVENTQVLEGAAPGQKELVFRLNLIGTFAPGLLEATVDYSTGNIAIDTATAGLDYTSVSGTLTFTDNNRLQEVRIPITGDTNPLETDETVSLRFTNAVGLGLSRNFAVGTIVNDDSPNVVVSITPSVSKIREGHSGTQQVELFVTLIGQPTTDVTVNYATANHHATDGTDYVAVDDTVTFTLADIAAGLSQKSIFVTINGDTDIELDEGFSVSLSLPTAPPNVSLDPDKTLARLVIRNDDQAVLTEDGDALFVELLADLTSIFNAGGGAKNNPALVAAMQRRAELIAQSLRLTRAIILIIDPVDFVLTDPGDRQSGYTEDTGSINQVPGTYYSGDGAVELLIIPLPPDGTYNVQLAGLGGDFNASVTIVDGNNTTHGVVSDFTGQYFQNGDLAVQIGEGQIPVGLGLAAAHSGAASTFGVVGAFGHSDFRLALASALEQAISKEFAFDDSDSRTTGLMYWLSVSARALRQQVIEPLWQSLETPLGDLLGEGRLTRIEIPSEFVDQFWSQVGQTLTGVPSGIYRLGNMLESVIPTLVPRRIRSTLPRSGDQGTPSSGVKTKRSSLERPRVTPPTPRNGSGQAQPPNKPNATQDKSAQTPSSKKTDGQQVSTSHTRVLWFNFKNEKSATPTERRV